MQLCCREGEAHERDGRSPLELRVKEQFSANQFQALFHAGESKPSPHRDPFNIKTTSLIADGQLDLVHRTYKRHSELLCTAMLQRILQGFLQNAKKTKRDRLR